MGRPLAYFLTWTCYGTWLHGDERGSVDADHNQFGSSFVAKDMERWWEELRSLDGQPDVLSPAEREIVDATIRAHCEFRRWGLHAVNVRTNHVHLVVTADLEPKPVMEQFKAWCTRRLREAGLAGPQQSVWTEGGSKRYVWTREQLARVVEYVTQGQGDKL